MTWDVGDWCRYIYYGGMRKNSDEASVGRAQIVAVGPELAAVSGNDPITFVQPDDLYPDTSKGDMAACDEADRRNAERGYPA